jgi:hypothetical protein
MKNQTSIRPWIWYAPVITGWSYIIVCILLLFVDENSRYKPLGDMFWNIGVIFIVVSMYLFHKLDLNGKNTWRKISLFIPVIGSVSYQVGAITNYFGEPVIIFYPLGALLTAIGMTVVGIQVIIAKQLKRWKRFTPLLVGLYPFIVMFPIVMITGSPSIYAIMLWGLPWIIVGRVMLGEYYKFKRAMT